MNVHYSNSPYSPFPQDTAEVLYSAFGQPFDPVTFQGMNTRTSEKWINDYVASLAPER